MKTTEALKLVLELAKQNIVPERLADMSEALTEERQKQKEACEVIEAFVSLFADLQKRNK